MKRKEFTINIRICINSGKGNVLACVMVSDVNICPGLARLCFPQTQTVYWPEPRVISGGEGDDDIYINLDIIEGSIPTLASILQCPEAVMDLCADTTTHFLG